MTNQLGINAENTWPFASAGKFVSIWKSTTQRQRTRDHQIVVWKGVTSILWYNNRNSRRKCTSSVEAEVVVLPFKSDSIFFVHNLIRYYCLSQWWRRCWIPGVRMHFTSRNDNSLFSGCWVEVSLNTVSKASVYTYSQSSFSMSTPFFISSKLLVSLLVIH